MDQLEHALDALELPDAARRAGGADAGSVDDLGDLPAGDAKKMQCGQLWVDEWNGVGGAPELFTLLQSWRQRHAGAPAVSAASRGQPRVMRRTRATP